MNIVALYADGGVIQINPSPIGGMWAFCHVDADNQRARTASGVVLPRTSCPLITNNLTEMVALVKGLEALPEGWAGVVYSDSQITLGRLFEDWKMSGIPPVLIRQGNTAKARLDWASCTYALLDGHPTKAQLAAGKGKRGAPVSEHNVWCDLQCGKESAAFTGQPPTRPNEYAIPADARPIQCRSCGTGMVFIKTPAGKALPLSVATIETRDGVRYALPHFADCKDSKLWSKK